MAATAQTRITEDTRARVARLAQQTGRTQQEVIDVAVRRYERDLFLDGINEGYAELRADKDAWTKALAERAEWDDTLADGVED